MAMASSVCTPLLHWTSTTAVAARRNAFDSPLQTRQAAPTLKLTFTSSLGLQTRHGFSMSVLEARTHRLWSLQSGSPDQQDIVATGEQKVSELKESVAETEETGPPFLTIFAGIFVAVLVFWGLWSLLSVIVGLFVR